jgi:hypothetical protein
MDAGRRFRRSFIMPVPVLARAPMLTRPPPHNGSSVSARNDHLLSRISALRPLAFALVRP